MLETQTTGETTLSEEELHLIDAYWRAANYLSVAQIYLLDKPLLREPLQPEHVKPRLLGHFGTVPGLNLLYAHLNRQIRERDLSAIYITGPGHGGPALVANAYLEGTYSELYPNSSRDEGGLNDEGGQADVVLGCAGDIPTLETLAAAALLREHLPELKVRVINVLDLMRLQSETEHPHGLSDSEFDALFTRDKPIVFAYHGYPWLIHRLTYRRAGHANLHVRGYKEEGTTTTPFDMVMLNDLDRFHLVIDVIDRVPGLAERAAHLCQEMEARRLRARAYTRKHGDDDPEIRDWTWPY